MSKSPKNKKSKKNKKITAKIIVTTTDGGDFGFDTCGNCATRIDGDRPKICPHCGCKLEGEEIPPYPGGSDF